MISRQFFKSSIIYSIVGALPYASGFLLLPWFTSFLTPVQFGVNALYITLMYFFQIIASIGLDVSTGVLYFDFKDSQLKLKKFLGTVFLGLVGTGFFTILVFSVGGFKLFNVIFHSAGILEFLPFGLLTVLSSVFNTIFKTYTTLLINQERPIRFFWMNGLNFILTICSSLFILYLFPFTLFVPILGRLIPAITSASLTLFLISTEYGIAFDKSLIKQILRYCLPLFVYSILSWIVSYADRFIILRFLSDPTYVGIYDFGVKLVLFLDLIIVGIISTVQPKVFNIWKIQHLNQSTTEVNRYYNGVTALILMLVPVFVILAPIIIPLFIKKEIYYGAFSFISILSLGYVTRTWFYMFMAPLMFFKKTEILPKIFFISALFQVIAGVFLIKYFGIMGAVWTNFLVKPLQAILLYVESRKVFSYKLNQWKLVYIPVIFIFVVLISEILSKNFPKIYFQIGHCFIAFILLYFAYRKEIILLISKRDRFIKFGRFKDG